MATRRVNDPNAQPTPRRRATTPEGRENQIVAMAVDLAERQIADGTASAQVITHFLKMGSTREKLEQERLHEEVSLKRAQREQLESQARVEELYTKALDAMRGYKGDDPEPTADDDGY